MTKKQVLTSNSGYNRKAMASIAYNEEKYGMCYDDLMAHIKNTLASHHLLNLLIKKHICKLETVDTHVYILFKSNYSYKNRPIGDVVASIVNSLFFGMCLDRYADTINNSNIAGWCSYNKFTFVSPTLFTPSRVYVRTHTRQQIKALYK